MSAAAPAVGVDLVDIDRIEAALARRPRLAERLFTDAEREYAQGHRRPARQLAARFAAKEATIKALALRGAAMSEIEVIPGKPPELRLHGAVGVAARDVRLAVSLSHERTHAVAVVLATPE